MIVVVAAIVKGFKSADEGISRIVSPAYMFSHWHELIRPFGLETDRYVLSSK
jgi:hypothetical protein